MRKHNQPLSAAEIRQKVYRYCAYQERSHLEVKNKLFELGATKDEVEAIVSELITQGFLNEERFARAYAGGKFRLKFWGKVKIRRSLEARGLTPNCIKAGLSEIDDEAYERTLMELIEKKSGRITSANLYVKRDKLANYLIQKGFESELVWSLIKEKVTQ